MFSRVNAFGSNGLAIVEDAQSKLWGIIDTEGNYIVEPKYVGAGTRFSDGLLWVREPDNKIGYIDSSGAYAIEPQFDAVHDFSEGFACVSSSTQSFGAGNHYYCQVWSYIDTSGKKITPEIFYEAYDFSGGYAIVNQNYPQISTPWYTYIDTTGTQLDLPQLSEATPFSDGLAFGQAPGNQAVDDRTILFDTKGNILFWSTLFDSPGSTSSWNSDLCPVRLTSGTGYVYINQQGDVILPKTGETYGYARSFSNGYALVTDRQTNLTGVIDIDGNWVIAPEYTSVDYISSDGLVQVGTTQSVCLMNIHGDCVMEFDLTNEVKPLGSLRRELILVGSYAEDGSIAKAGFWDQSGNVVIDCIFEQASDFSYDMGYAKVKSNGKWGMIDRDGNWLIPANYLTIRV